MAEEFLPFELEAALKACIENRDKGRGEVLLWPAWLRSAAGEEMKTFFATVRCKSGKQESAVSLALEAFTVEEARLIIMHFFKKLSADVGLKCPFFEVTAPIESGDRERILRIVKANKGHVVEVNPSRYHIVINMIKMQMEEEERAKKEAQKEIAKDCRELKKILSS